LTILALVVPEISSGVSKFQVGHMTMIIHHFKGDFAFLCWDLT